jgi:hypothetical protein
MPNPNEARAAVIDNVDGRARQEVLRTLRPRRHLTTASQSPLDASADQPPLPLYVGPAAEEALLSWLLRLATRLRVSFHVLARQAFGIDDRTGQNGFESCCLAARARHARFEGRTNPPCRSCGRYSRAVRSRWRRSLIAGLARVAGLG